MFKALIVRGFQSRGVGKGLPTYSVGKGLPTYSEQLHEGCDHANLGKQHWEQPFEEVVPAPRDLELQIGVDLLDVSFQLRSDLLDLGADLLDLSTHLLDVELELRANLFDLGADLLDLLLQAQLALAYMGLGGQRGEVRVTLLQALEGLGDHPCTGAVVGRSGQGFVEGDA